MPIVLLITSPLYVQFPAAFIPVPAGESSTVVSPYLPGGVSDGQWHTLQLRYYNKVLRPAVHQVCVPTRPSVPTSHLLLCPCALLCPVQWCQGSLPFSRCRVSHGVFGSGGTRAADTITFAFSLRSAPWEWFRAPPRTRWPS